MPRVHASKWLAGVALGLTIASLTIASRAVVDATRSHLADHGRIVWSNLNEPEGWAAYKQSKLANLLHVEVRAREGKKQMQYNII